MLFLGFTSIRLGLSLVLHLGSHVFCPGTFLGQPWWILQASNPVQQVRGPTLFNKATIGIDRHPNS